MSIGTPAKRSGGGVWAAAGFRYQYLRTIEALLDLLEGGKQSETVRTEDSVNDAVDYSVRTADGDCLLLAQVKYSIDPLAGRRLSADEIKGILWTLTATNAQNYLIQTNRRLTTPAQELVQSIARLNDLSAPQQAIFGYVPTSASESVESAAPTDTHERLERLARCRIQTDERSSKELYQSVRERIQHYRRSGGLGVGDTSSNLLVNHIISVVFEKSTENQQERAFTFDAFRALLFLPEIEVSRSIGSYDWGIPIGNLPPAPAVRRISTIRRISAAFSKPAGSTSARYCAIVGLSGLGKSSLAASYATEYAAAYDWIVWIACDTDESIRQSMSAVVATVGTDSDKQDVVGMTTEQFAGRCTQIIARSVGTWLVIFDGTPSLLHLQQWLPTRGRVDILSTSTQTHGWPGWEVIQVEEMTESEAKDLVLQRLKIATDLSADSDSATALASLIERTSKWPLALDLACAFLSGSGRGLRFTDDYIQKLGATIYASQSLLPHYPRSLIAAVQLALEDIRVDTHQGALARLALDVLAYLPSVGVPLRTVIQAARLVPLVDALRSSDRLSEVDDLQIDETFIILTARGLVRRINPARTQSPLIVDLLETNDVVLEVIRELSEPEARIQVLSATIATVSMTVINLQDQLDFYAMQSFLIIGITVTQHAFDNGFVSIYGLALLGNVGEALMFNSEFSIAANAFEMQLRIVDLAGFDAAVTRAKAHSALAACGAYSSRPVEYICHHAIRTCIALRELGTQGSENERRICLDRARAALLLLLRSGRVEAGRISEVLQELDAIDATLSTTTPSEDRLIGALLARLDDPDDASTARRIEEYIRTNEIAPHSLLQLKAGLIEAYAGIEALDAVEHQLADFIDLSARTGLFPPIGVSCLIQAALVLTLDQAVWPANDYSDLAYKLLTALEGHVRQQFDLYKVAVVRGSLSVLSKSIETADEHFGLIGPEPELPYPVRSSDPLRFLLDLTAQFLHLREWASGTLLVTPTGATNIRRFTMVDGPATYGSLGRVEVTFTLNSADFSWFSNRERASLRGKWVKTPFGVGVGIQEGATCLRMLWITAYPGAGASRLSTLADEVKLGCEVLVNLRSASGLFGPLRTEGIMSLKSWVPDRRFRL